MAHVSADRVKEATATTGTGTVTLTGAAPAGYRTFASALASGDTCYYAMALGAEWEVGLGAFTTAGNTLARTTVLASSNANAAVNFSAGNKDVFITAAGAQFGGATPQAVAATASPGASGVMARADHVHAGVTSVSVNGGAAQQGEVAVSTPVPATTAPPQVATSNVVGTSTEYARADHTHGGVAAVLSGTGIGVSNAGSSYTINNTGVTSISLNGGAAQTGAVSINTTGAADIPVVLGNATAAAETIIARFQLPANFFAAANDAAKVVAHFHSGATAGTHTLRVRIGTAGTTADALVTTIGATASVVANSYCEAQILVMTPTVGAAGTVRAQGFHRFTATLTSNAAAALAAATALNTTAALFISVSIQASAASATAATQGAWIQKGL